VLTGTQKGYLASGSVRKPLPSPLAEGHMWGISAKAGAEMSIAYRKIQICAFLCFATIMGCIRTAEAQTVTLDCFPQTGTIHSINGKGVHGLRVVVNYSTSTVDWFGYLMDDGGIFAMVYGAPAQITDTTIGWAVPLGGEQPLAESLNRSTGVLYFMGMNEEPQVTCLCNISRAPPPKF
jgi:hypothetical protein